MTNRPIDVRLAHKVKKALGWTYTRSLFFVRQRHDEARAICKLKGVRPTRKVLAVELIAMAKDGVEEDHEPA